MTETADNLASLMQLIENLENLINANTLVAEGTITDVNDMRTIAFASAEQLKMNLYGTRLLLEGSDLSKQTFKQMQDLIMND